MKRIQVWADVFRWSHSSKMPTPLPCCKEFGVAEKQKKLVVVYKDNIDTIKVAPANDFNGNVLMYVVNEDQGLNPDVDEIVAELEKLL